jgi:hypothetical protein
VLADDAERERIRKLRREAAALEQQLADNPAAKLARLQAELAASSNA